MTVLLHICLNPKCVTESSRGRSVTGSFYPIIMTSQKRYGISNHWHLDCLLNNLFGLSRGETSKIRDTVPLWGDSTGDQWIPHTNYELCKKGYVAWRHHTLDVYDLHPVVSFLLCCFLEKTFPPKGSRCISQACTLYCVYTVLGYMYRIITIVWSDRSFQSIIFNTMYIEL